MLEERRAVQVAQIKRRGLRRLGDARGGGGKPYNAHLSPGSTRLDTEITREPRRHVLRQYLRLPPDDGGRKEAQGAQGRLCLLEFDLRRSSEPIRPIEADERED